MSIIYYPGLPSGGSVTSVGFIGDGTILSSAPSTPVTTSGNISATLLTQNANLLLAGPSSGGAAFPTFRTLVNVDINPAFTNPTAATSILSPTSPSLVFAYNRWDLGTGPSTATTWTIQAGVTGTVGTNAASLNIFPSGTGLEQTAVNITGNIILSGGVFMQNGGRVQFGNTTSLEAALAGNLDIINAVGGSAAGSISFTRGITPASRPAIFARTGTNIVLNFRTADDSADIGITAATLALNDTATAGGTISHATRVVTLSASDLNNLYVTPKQVLPAPGTNLTYIINNVLTHYTYTTSAFTLNGATELLLQFTSTGSGGVSSIYICSILAGLTDQTQDEYSQGLGGDAGIMTTSLQVNQALYITNDVANMSGGDGTVTFTIDYSIIDTTQLGTAV